MRRVIAKSVLSACVGAWGLAMAADYPEQCLRQLEKGLGQATTAARRAHFQQLIANTRQVREGIAESKLWTDQPLACYAVPAISPIKRLPDVLPVDGRLREHLRLVGAKGEFVPGSLVVFPFEDVDRMQLKCADLKGERGSIPASAVDLKVVKCWYQAGTAWHSYFKDPTRAVLIPELLLNDENLVKVDHDKQANYLRADYPEGSEYLWMTFPGNVARRPCLNILQEPIADSPTLLPVELTAGECKQFWITVGIPEQANPGFYRGTLSFNARGKTLAAMDLRLRVLPFSLPEPKTFYDLDREFIVSIYDYMGGRDLQLAGGDRELLKRQVVNMYKNMLDHNIRYFHLPNDDPETLSFYYEAQKEAGVDLKMAFGPYRGFDSRVVYRRKRPGWATAWELFVKRQDAVEKFCREKLPDARLYSFGGSEIPFTALAKTADTARNVVDRGAYNYVDMHLKNLIKGGAYNVDLFNTPRYRNAPSDGEEARKAHALGLRLMSYGSPHSGPENPDLIRRTHGLTLYKADFDGVKQCGYKPIIWYDNCWNEFAQPPDSFRINFVYPTRDGVVDTLHWEGFREAIDDVRYATKLLQLARDAIATGDVDKRYAARKAMQYLATMDWKEADLNAARLEMINYILELQGLLKGEA